MGGSREQGAVSWEEGAARELLERAGEPEPPISAFAVAKALGYRVYSSPAVGARMLGDTIEVCGRYRRERRHFRVAHELAHTVMDPQIIDRQQRERAADYVAGAVLLPRDDFDRDLRATGWDLRVLRAKHVNASAEVIVRRIVEMRDAVACIFDEGRLKTRVWSPWLGEGYRKISKFERELAAKVLSSGRTTRADNLLWGFPVFEGSKRRVAVVCEAEQLGFRY